MFLPQPVKRLYVYQDPCAACLYQFSGKTHGGTCTSRFVPHPPSRPPVLVALPRMPADNHYGCSLTRTVHRRTKRPIQRSESMAAYMNHPHCSRMNAFSSGNPPPTAHALLPCIHGCLVNANQLRQLRNHVFTALTSPVSPSQPPCPPLSPTPAHNKDGSS